MTEVTQPSPAATVPRPRRQGNAAALAPIEREEPEYVLEPAEAFVAGTYVAPLPPRREEPSRRLAEGLREDMLTVLESASRLFGIEPVHLVAALGEERGRSDTPLAPMKATVQEEFL